MQDADNPLKTGRRLPLDRLRVSSKNGLPVGLLTAVNTRVLKSKPRYPQQFTVFTDEVFGNHMKTFSRMHIISHSLRESPPLCLSPRRASSPPQERRAGAWREADRSGSTPRPFFCPWARFGGPTPGCVVPQTRFTLSTVEFSAPVNPPAGVRTVLPLRRGRVHVRLRLTRFNRHGEFYLLP